MKGKINEIFSSIQGEGVFVGERQVFVRLAGCNLKCAYCDTDIRSWEEHEPAEALAAVKKHGKHFHSVSFTGGEPLCQTEFLKELMRLTRAEGYRNYLETNGTLPDELKQVIGLCDFVAMDLKLPGSTGLKAYWDEHCRFLRACGDAETFIKAVVCETTVESDIFESIRTISEARPNAVLVLQPDSRSKDTELLGRIMESFRMLCHKRGIAACVIPQVHRIIGVK